MELLEFKDSKCTPDIIHPYTTSVRNNRTPIVIDNGKQIDQIAISLSTKFLSGSYQCRAGWSTSPEPLLIFKNLIAKPRKERTKKDTQIETNQVNQQQPQLQVGNDIVNIEAVRFQLKTQFDRNIVTHFEAQEHLFDYTFTHLGLDTDNCVPHPIVCTEAILNPNSSRQRKTLPFTLNFTYLTRLFSSHVRTSLRMLWSAGHRLRRRQFVRSSL